MKKLYASLLAIGAALAVALAIVAPPAAAAVTNIAPSVGQVLAIPLQLSGAYSASVTGAARFNMPFPCKLIGVGAAPREVTGSSNTVDVLLGGVSVLSAPIATTAATYTEGTITTSSITDEGAITVDLAIPDGSLTDVTVLLTCVRR